MIKFNYKELIFSIIGVILAPTTFFIYKGYKKSTTLSTFESAASRLGFNGYNKANLNISSAEHQEALLKVSQIAGYFSPEKVWQCINALKVNNPTTLFKQMYPIIKKSQAEQANPKAFNAKILRKNFGKGTTLDEQDMMNFIVPLVVKTSIFQMEKL